MKIEAVALEDIKTGMAITVKVVGDKTYAFPTRVEDRCEKHLFFGENEVFDSVQICIICDKKCKHEMEGTYEPECKHCGYCFLK